MNLQQAIDIIHEIREQFTHVCPGLTEYQGRYIIGCYQGSWLGRSWVISSAWDWQEFMLLFAIFANK